MDNEIRIASTAYFLPPQVESVDEIIRKEYTRVESALEPLSDSLRQRVIKGLKIKCVHVCTDQHPYDLVLEAATEAIRKAEIEPGQIDLIIDFSTLPGKSTHFMSIAQKLSSELEADTALNISFKIGGCAGLHLAMKTALSLMQTDDSYRTALLVAGDSPPEGSRSILPVTIQGDAGSAVILRKDINQGPVIIGTEVQTLGYLHDTIMIQRDRKSPDGIVIQVDSERIENDLMPIYYLNFYRLLERLLSRTNIKLDEIDHFIYSNLSWTDQEGFIRAFRLPEEKVYTDNLTERGHTFASDLVINYTDLYSKGKIEPGQLLLFASAGIGFTWGLTLARA